MHESVTVGTGDFRQALNAVRVHASADKESPNIHRVRLTFGRQHVTVSATDRFTAGMALVSLWGDPPAGGYTVLGVELLPDDVAKILSIFKGGKDTGGEPEYLLRLEVLDGYLLITDCSGMIEGRALKVPRLSTDDSALDHIPGTIASATIATSRTIGNMAVSGDAIARFRAASVAYGAPLIVEGRGERSSTLLVRCGESFLGLMVSRTLDDDKREQADEWAESWSYRLPHMVDEAASIADAEPDDDR